MRYTRTGIIAVLIAAEVFIASIIVVSAGGLKTFSAAGSAHDFSYAPYSLPAVEAGSRPHVVIDDPDSRVVVTASTDGQVHVTDATRIGGWGWGSRPQHLQIRKTGDGVVIERPATPGRIVIFGFEMSRTEVALPADAALEITHSGGADVSDLTGTISVHSDDGHIMATNLRSGDVALTTADGRITLDNIDADKLAVSTQDGSIRASSLRVRNGSAHTSDGSISLAFADTGDLTLHARPATAVSVSTARVKATRRHRSTINLETAPDRWTSLRKTAASASPRTELTKMGNSDNFVAVVAILVVFGMPLAFAMAHRWWSHQERLEMIRRGIPPPLDPRAARKAERAGYGQFTYSRPDTPGYASSDPNSCYYPDRMLRKGVTVAMIGLALLIGLSFIRPGTPGPWLLGGLIPLFVGLAQIILAVMSGANFGGWTLQGPQPVQRGTMPGQPPPDGPYAWRPGQTTELEPPVRPPDIRQ